MYVYENLFCRLNDQKRRVTTVKEKYDVINLEVVILLSKELTQVEIQVVLFQSEIYSYVGFITQSLYWSRLINKTTKAMDSISVWANNIYKSF